MKPLFENPYLALGPDFAIEGKPRAPISPKLLVWNESLARDLNLQNLSDEEKLSWFSGREESELRYFATAYAGHQFGRFVPRLGDGRVFFLGALRDQLGRRQELQLKGAGPTAFSRGGDGLAAVGPVLREYLLSEFMHAVGVPTTRSLSMCLTGDPVFRQQPEPGAVLCRVAPSHLRVGSFEYFAQRGDRAGLKTLLGIIIADHFPELESRADPALDFFRSVASRLATLVADWIGIGFVHGVLNTDNTSLLGLTLDYGPCAFLDEYDPEKVFSSIDREGRYRFSNQAAILEWNLARLAESLIFLAETPPDGLVETYQEELRVFRESANTQIVHRLCAKLGWAQASEKRLELLRNWLSALQKSRFDSTLAWSHLAACLKENARLPEALEIAVGPDFLRQWLSEGPDEVLLDKNPRLVPRNHHVDFCIRRAQEGNFGDFHNLLACVQKPFALADDSRFYLPAEEHEKITRTFCGT